MKSFNNKIEQEQKKESNFRAISKGQKFKKIDDKQTVSDEERSFYDLPQNIGKTFIGKNRIY